MSEFADALAEVARDAPVARTRAPIPKGFEPGVSYEAGTVTTPAIPAIAGGESEWREAVEKSLGWQVPEGHKLELVEARYDPAAWHRDAQGEDAVTRPCWRYRFKVVPDGGGNVEELLAAIEKWKPGKAKSTPTGTAYFTAVFADMQVGKAKEGPEQHGTEQTVARVLAVTDAAVAEYKRLSRGGHVGPVALVFPGDGCEGLVSQGGRLAWRVDLTMTEMVRVYRRLVQHIVLAFAKVAPRVLVVGVGGNHDQAVRMPVVTRPDDSWDVEAAAAVADALALRDDLSHVSFVFPQRDTDIVTVDLDGTITAVAHGHQAKGGAEKWWAGQAHGLQPAGEATLLLTGHFHHLRVVETGAKTWIQGPALDNGSGWYARERGENAAAGLLTLVVGGGGYDHLRVLRA